MNRPDFSFFESVFTAMDQKRKERLEHTYDSQIVQLAHEGLPAPILGLIRNAKPEVVESAMTFPASRTHDPFRLLIVQDRLIDPTIIAGKKFWFIGGVELGKEFFSIIVEFDVPRT